MRVQSDVRVGGRCQNGSAGKEKGGALGFFALRCLSNFKYYPREVNCYYNGQDELIYLSLLLHALATAKHPRCHVENLVLSVCPLLRGGREGNCAVPVETKRPIRRCGELEVIVYETEECPPKKQSTNARKSSFTHNSPLALTFDDALMI